MVSAGFPMPWQPLYARHPTDATAAIRPCSFEAAQEWCNFVVFEPALASWRLEALKLRPESPPGPASDPNGRPHWTPSNRACVRFELANGTTRIRVKEYLYDWAPPAFDCPSLWKHQVRGTLVGDNVAWFGFDFRGLMAASLQRDRTMIELSALEGQPADATLLEILSSLRPVVPSAHSAIAATSWAKLSYQSRHIEPAIAVPCGFWRYRREKGRGLVEPSEGSGAILAPASSRLSTGGAEYRLDSTFAFRSKDGLVDVDNVYVHVGDPGISVRLLWSPRGCSDGVAFPPILDDQPCFADRMTIDDADVHHAWVDSEWGPHEYAARVRDLHVMVLIKPAPWTTTEWSHHVAATVFSAIRISPSST